MTKSAHHSGTSDVTVDMNPMLDIVFILLIFFIVTASFMRETALPINRTDQAVTSIVPSLTPVFTIDAKNQIYLNNRKIDIDTVSINIARLGAQGELTSISLRAHPDSQHATLVGVLDAIKAQTSAPVSLGDTL
ncbi:MULTISPECIES: biopolymer transporter ExbD [unclassified Pseudoalteromonas]|uniref:ExbD/TolR family protein n=1 Tax=unclassified Pseudoalteromonas TaxID=194690 RepID=UPI0020985744|nr:biopolymer transporter ExbD [Pseudoalteromonas sp. XMcav2-N]MCO7189118.1 biopolymer transporter ExbD [Pseudoalteromonas sp. XMcav2-N]